MKTSPFQDIYNACNCGTGAEKLKNPLDFPRYIDIELTNLCNFRCKMCPTGQNTTKRTKGFMSDEIWNIIFKQLSEYKIAIRFIRWGEPTLHHRLYDWIAKAKNNGLLVHINTNGKLLDIDMIIKCGLDSIKFSFQGLGREEYLEWRQEDYFLELTEKIKDIYSRNPRPYIMIGTTIINMNIDGNVFRTMMSPISDKVIIGQTRILSEPVKQHRECPEVFDKLSINWDGTVSACCGDYDNLMVVGDVRKEPLKKIWENKKMNYYRKILSNFKHNKIALCRNCI